MYPVYAVLENAGKIEADVLMDLNTKESGILKYRLNTVAKVGVAAILCDTAISTTSLAFGVLGLLGLIQGIPPAASYSLLAVSGIVTLGWISLCGINKGKPAALAYHLLKASVSKTPKLPSKFAQVW